MNTLGIPTTRQTSLKDTVFVSLDFETTGLRPAQDRIIEIGAVRFTLDGLSERFSTFVDPEMMIPRETIRIHGISDSMVAGSGPISDHLSNLEEFLGDAVIVAHNVKFDLGFYNAARERLQMDLVQNLYLDSCTLSRRVFPGRRSYSLQNLIREFHIPSGKAHRALDDAVACANLALRAFDHMGAQPDWNLGKVIRLSGTRYPKK